MKHKARFSRSRWGVAIQTYSERHPYLYAKHNGEWTNNPDEAQWHGDRENAMKHVQHHEGFLVEALGICAEPQVLEKIRENL